MKSSAPGTAAPRPRETPRGFAIGRFGGVPVIAQVVPGTGTGLAIAMSIVLGVLLGISVLAHELGHCWAARVLGMQVVGVRLYLLGGVSELAKAPRSPREEAIIAAAGPAVSAVIAGAFWIAVAATTPGTVGWLLVMLLALSNLVVAVFNLLPALPLDGGRVLRAGVWSASGNRRAGTTVAVIGGYVIAVALVGWAVLILLDAGSAGLLPAGIAVAMALFVAVGAAGEGRQHGRSNGWPADVSIASVARPVAQLPTETPVALALEAAATRDVVLTDDDPTEFAERARVVDAADFLLVDESGQPAGVLRREDIAAVLNSSRSRKWSRP